MDSLHRVWGQLRIEFNKTICEIIKFEVNMLRDFSMIATKN